MSEIVAEASIVQFIRNYGLAAIFTGMILEEVLFVIPAALIIVSAGALLVETTALWPALVEIFLEISLIGSLGITAGSFFMYGAGLYGGKPAINRIGKYANFSWQDVESFESHFSDEKEKSYLMLFRILPIFPITTVSVAAGIFRMDWKPYGLITFIGMIPRHIGYGYLGWKAGQNYGLIVSKIKNFSRTLTLIGAAALVVYIFYRKYGQKLKSEVRNYSL
ncbi:MAG: DedA family protein [Candidatus Nanohaloarchaea archaeon]